MKRFTFFLVISFLVGNLNAQIPTEGLVAYYPFNGNANDESGNNLDGTIYGSIPSADRFGFENSAYSFDGVNDYIKMLGLPTNYAEYTFCAWVKSATTTPSISMGVVSQNGLGTVNWGSFGLINNVTNYKVMHRDGTQTLQSISSINAIDLNWHFISLTWDGSEMKLYFDGIFENSFSTNTITTIYDELLIGALNNNGTAGNFFNGTVDDVRIYNQDLSGTEITTLFNENLCSDIIVDLFTEYYVSDLSFENISPKSYLVNVENLLTTIGGCDSIVNHYDKYTFNPNYFSDTITVTDTLIIDVTITGINPPENVNTIKIYPNPAVDYVIINTGNYEIMSDYEIKIENSIGQTVYQTQTNQSEFQINVNDFGSYGLYFVKIIDNLGNVIVTRKLILE